jgi:hypothetical protein
VPTFLEDTLHQLLRPEASDIKAFEKVPFAGAIWYPVDQWDLGDAAKTKTFCYE